MEAQLPKGSTAVPTEQPLLLSLAADVSQADRLRHLLLETPHSELLAASEAGTGHSPLIKAALYGNSTALRLLVGSGADVRATGVGGHTALHLSAMRGDADSVRCLLAAGAELGALNSAGKTPADLATDREVRQLLMAHASAISSVAEASPAGQPTSERPTVAEVAPPRVGPAAAVAVTANAMPRAISGPKKLPRGGPDVVQDAQQAAAAGNRRAAVKEFLQKRRNNAAVKDAKRPGASAVADNCSNIGIKNEEVKLDSDSGIKSQSENKDLQPAIESGNKDLQSVSESSNKDFQSANVSGQKGTQSISDKDLKFAGISVLQWRQGPLLGRGSYGSVHQALTDCGRIIAVKRVSADCEAELRRIRREVDILSSMSHPNIVQLFGTRQSGQDFHIAMELVPGGSVRNLLDRFGALTERQCRRYLTQVVSGLAFLHRNGILHGDIKGHNIMVTDAGAVKLIDFGCSRRLHHQHIGSGEQSQSCSLASLNGTPYWMAPEVVLAIGCPAGGQQLKSDCWSVGCTLLEMATTRPPYSEMQPFAAVFAIGQGSPEPPAMPSNFSQLAADFYAACLRRELADRPSAQELLEHEFLLDSP